MLKWAIISAILFVVFVGKKIKGDSVHYGPMKQIKEDDIASKVMCPSKTVGVSCECEDKANCDGTLFTDEMTCKMYHAPEKPETRAVVKCRSMKKTECPKIAKPEDIKDPPGAKKYNNKRQLSVTCPEGTTLTNCHFYSPLRWQASMKDVHAVLESENTCKMNKKCPMPCTVRARCIKKYKKGNETTVSGNPTSDSHRYSIAQCPPKTVALTCKCENNETCYGSTFTDERSCIIYNFYRKPSNKAIVTCRNCQDVSKVEVEDIRVPESGFDNTKILTATCPCTHSLTGCSFYAQRSSLSNGTIATVMEGNTCETTEICAGGCSIQARCLPT